MSSIARLEPRWLWQHFESICRIPRPSGQERGIREYVRSWSASCGLTSRVDDVGNVVVYVPAKAVLKNAPTIVLQCHLDMVCERNGGIEFDFTTQPIDAYVDGDLVRARGTTLGADNGIGLAAAMAVVDDISVMHGPLELVFTVDEETGLTGAKGLGQTLVSGRILLNLDSEHDGKFFVGCAGGVDAKVELTVRRAPDPIADADSWTDVEICVLGCKGGHSGLNIVENRANALKLLARVLQEVWSYTSSLRIVSILSGDKTNAIPREACAVVRVLSSEVDLLNQIVALNAGYICAEFGSAEPEMNFVVSAKSSLVNVDVLDEESSIRVIDLLLALPSGVLTMSRDIAGLVETSTNLARVRLDADKLNIALSNRSSVAKALDGVLMQISSCAALAGAQVTVGKGYPGWRPNMSSPLLRTARIVYRGLFSEHPDVTAIHAGLECGVIGERFPDMDMISFGPQIDGAHSPDERVSITSTAKFYTLLCALLERFAI